MQSTLNLPVIGLDLAKSVFQLHIVDVESGEIQRRQIKRAKLTEFFAKCNRSLVAMDAQAIWVAAQQPHILPVPVKSERQQACLALHGMRRQMMKMRIMQTNALRGILAEFGIAMPVGHNQLLKMIQAEIAEAQEKGHLPADLVICIQDAAQTHRWIAR